MKKSGYNDFCKKCDKLLRPKATHELIDCLKEVKKTLSQNCSAVPRNKTSLIRKALDIAIDKLSEPEKE